MSVNPLLRICDFIFVLRPLILIPAWSFYLLGAAQAIGRNPVYPSGFPSPTAFVSLTAILITAYLLNQIFDRESDEKNEKCFYLSRGIFRVRTVLILAVLSFLVASFAFRRLGGTLQGPLFVALILSLIYSLPPIRLCMRPFLDLLANAAGYGGVAFVLGYGVFDGSRGAAVLASLPFVLLVAATFLHTAILDVTGDKATGKISTAVFIGAAASSRLAVVLHGLGIAAALVFGSTLSLVITAATFPMSAFAAAKATRISSVLLVQMNTFVVGMAAVATWPAFGMIVVPLVVLSRYYHKRRFGIIYPGPARSA